MVSRTNYASVNQAPARRCGGEEVCGGGTGSEVVGGGQVKHISLQGKRSSFSRHSGRLQVELQLFIIDVLS